MNAGLVSDECVIRLSAPWELGEKLGWKALPARIEAVKATDDGFLLLLRLHEPIENGGAYFSYFVAKPRYVGNAITDLSIGASLVCGFTPTSDERKGQIDFGLGSWRGGGAMLGELTLILSH